MKSGRSKGIATCRGALAIRAKPPAVGLLLGRDAEWNRGIIAGVAEHVHGTVGWRVMQIDPYRPMEALRADGDALVGVIGALTPGTPEARLLAVRRIPFISVSNRRVPSAPSVLGDDVRVGKLAAEHLMECGLRQFGFLGIPSLQFSDERLKGFSDALEHHGCKVSVCACEGDPPTQQEQIRAWLRSLPLPVGVFGCNDTRARHVSWACEAVGLRVPEQVAIIGVDNDVVDCELVHTPLTSVIVPFQTIGRLAGQMLRTIVSGQPLAARVVRVPPLGIQRRRSTQVRAYGDPLIHRAVDLICQHACDPISVKELVAELFVSRRLLEVRFRREVGWTVHGEIRRVQLERARTLLADSHLPVPEVARLCGHSDWNRFSQYFRRAYGTSPARYRHEVRSGSPDAGG